MTGTGSEKGSREGACGEHGGEPGIPISAAFTHGVSLGESISQCMDRGKKRATEIIRQFNPYK